MGSGSTSTYRTFTFFGCAFQRIQWFRAYPLSLAATYGVSVDFLSSGYLDVSVPRVCFVRLYIQRTMTLSGRVSPFGHPYIKAWLPAPQGFSQVPTSFIAS